MNCNKAQALLLDYLFDVLDQDEKQPFDSHLKSCGDCQKELGWAKNQQKLLKSATLDSFPEVIFRADDLLAPATTPAETQKTGKAWSVTRWGLMVAATALVMFLPAWALLWKQENNQAISLAYNQDSGKSGTFLIPVSQLENTVDEAISLVQKGLLTSDSGHKALSIEKVVDSNPILKTIVFVSDTPLKPGSGLEVKTVTLDTGTLKLAKAPLDIRYVLRGPGFERTFSVNGKGSTQNNLPAKFPDGTEVTGIGMVLFDLPNEITGGKWELEVSESRGRFPAVRKNIAVEGPRTQITQTVQWEKDQYKPGDRVKLTVRVNLGDGKPAPGAKINMTLVIGGVPWNPETKGTRRNTMERIADENGACSFEFELPQKPSSGQNEILIQSRSGESFLSEKYPLQLWR
jgi:hypothetical protein